VDNGIRSFQLDLYGDGRNKEILKMLVQELRLQSVVNFKGFSSSVPYNRYDFAIMASKSEAFGRVTIEYMLNSLPFV
jgi:glycosyltransferase involved in cell wall biosynthesis